ncbi:Thioesterase/thiol ester dehydrase-isomerase [Sarocladium strictum]
MAVTHPDPDENEIEQRLQSIIDTHPLVLAFRNKTGVETSRFVFNFDEDIRLNNLTESSLVGKDLIACRPFVFKDDAAGSILAVYHLGQKLAGHRGIIHGGLSALLLDDCMGRACFPRLIGKVGVTASLDLSYKGPAYVDSIIIVRADTRTVEGRKAWVDASIVDAKDDRLLLSATALFIEPKWAASMAKVL